MQREEIDMRFGKAIFPAALLAGLVSSGAALAWSTDGHGNIRCGDGSNATVAQQDDGTWTVTQAGKKGRAGGSFPTEGKAALSACGE
jgi:hypothetical protein